MLPSSGWLAPCSVVFKKWAEALELKKPPCSLVICPRSLVVEKIAKIRHVTCGVWSKGGLSRSECKRIISA